MRIALLLVAAASLRAAGLTATPSVVDWSYTSGSHNYPTQTIALTSSTGATSYSATATSGTGWLLVNGAYVSSSATLSAGAYLTPSFQIDRLDNGLYQGTVNITDQQGNTAPVTVNLMVSGGAPPPPAVITVNPSSLSFILAVAGPPQSQNVTVSGPASGNLIVTGPPWLQTATTGANGSYTVTVTAIPGALPPGTYRDNLVLSIGAVSATIPVTLTIQLQSNLIATPPVLSYEYTQGDVVPAGKFLTVTSSNGVVIPFAASSNTAVGNWISVMPPSGSTPFNLLVSIYPNGHPFDLAPGGYTGAVIITPLQGNQLIIPVNLTIRPQPLIAVSSGSVSFSYRSGGPLPAALRVQVAGGGTNPTYSVQVSGGNWLTATPPTGVAPGLVTISVNPAGLASGTYNALVTVTGTGSAAGSATIAVVLQVLDAAPTILAVANAAGYQTGSVAPGEIVTLFGSNLGTAGVQVVFNGVAAPMIYATLNQVSAIAPYELDGTQQAVVQVLVNGTASNQLTVPVVPAVPGIFTNGNGGVVAVHSDGSLNSAGNPAARGDIVVIYATGEGQTNPAGVTGKVTVTTTTPILPVTATIGGQTAAVAFGGEAPGFVAGLMQVNLTVPRALAAGTWPIVLSVGGKSSQDGVTIAIR